MKKRKPPITRVKAPEEIRNIEKAVDMAGKVFRELDNPFGRSEQDVAREIRQRIRKLGARPAFKPIVASGSTVIHHKPGKKIIRENKPLIVDLGVRYRGYCSDITRMYVPGDKKARKIYGYVLKIQKEVIKRIRPCAEFRDLQEVYKKLMKKKGYRVRHSIGHGVGMHVHERVKGELKAGMVLTVEPGIYKKGVGGFRIEDVILVRKGKPRVLSESIPQVLPL